MKKLSWVFLCEFIYVLLYFALFSRPLYRYGNIIETYYPIGIGIGVAVLLILNKTIFHWQTKTLSYNVLALVAMMFIVPRIVNIFAGGLLRDFYVRGYENLFHLPKYFKDVNVR